MTIGQLTGVALRGLRACVPATSRTLEDEKLIDDASERERLQKSIGVRSRHIARQTSVPQTCASALRKIC